MILASIDALYLASASAGIIVGLTLGWLMPIPSFLRFQRKGGVRIANNSEPEDPEDERVRKLVHEIARKQFPELVR